MNSGDSSFIDPIIILVSYRKTLSIAAFTNWLQIGLCFCPLVLITTNRVADTILSIYALFIMLSILKDFWEWEQERWLKFKPRKVIEGGELLGSVVVRPQPKLSVWKG